MSSTRPPSAEPRPVPAQPGNWFERRCDTLPGWVFCICGAAILAVVVLTPPWLDQHEAAWRLRAMQAQASALAEQTERYESFAAAIADDDPVVLERLALTHLRKTVAGKTPLWVPPVDQETGNVGDWLAVRQPVIGRDVPHYFAPNNRLTRLVTGPGRVALLLVGLLCLVAGVLFNPRTVRLSPPAPRRIRSASRLSVSRPHPMS
ncbi:hypothetical protein [Algisphaera agarilytica]|uniref:Uncharacterized protein n=1 Tax=Algisphaera agarilytica TaxID=1385975 RepID=A0A7X0HB63_9BACT|nr:hypothetical protein [Algisphaera agarilytica]MBB6431170.1 hypothetical protein [Algisphaera agarilytica]